MNICRTCISKLHPDYFNHVNPDTIPWSRGPCHHCGAHSETPDIIVATKETLDNPLPTPSAEPASPKKITRKAKKAATEPATIETERKTYQYLIADHGRDDHLRLPTYYAYTSKDELLASIKTIVFEQGRDEKDIDIYKLTPLPHKAEIKIEVGE